MNQQASTKKIRLMTPFILRYIWSVIEETQANILLKLSDIELLEHLLAEFADSRQLNVEELCLVKVYIYARIPLIREDAQSRLV